MDEFGLDRPELQGTFLTLEFGLGGRVQQLWCADSSRPADGEEFQFVAPPVGFGEEFAEDYFPGTVLIGARTSPDEPWILSRNGEVEVLDDQGSVTFEYQFGLLDEIRAVGKFYERPGPSNTIVWELTLTNRSRKTVEIGELAFPFALNNVYDGFPKTDDGLNDLYAERVTVHKAINGAASYLFAQRLNGRPPGLLIFPGGETSWEFYTHVASSLQTPYRWEGIPIVYIHSQAVIEREGWQPWVSEHSSAMLEPGQSRTYETCFAPALRDEMDQVNGVLIENGRPAVRLIPGAVVPADISIGVEVSGVKPTTFNTDVEADLDTDSDDEGGFCLVNAKKPGAVRLTFDDTLGRQSEAHLLFIEPIEILIQRRADWIMRHQVVRDAESPFFGAILPADNRFGFPLTVPQLYHSPVGIESSLADALFLTEKNSIFPAKDQILALDSYLDNFIAKRIQSPADDSIGAILSDPKAVASHFGRAALYPMLAFIFHGMSRIASGYGETNRTREEYLTQAARTLEAMYVHGHASSMDAIGLPLMSFVDDLLVDLYQAGMDESLHRLTRYIQLRDGDLLRTRYPFAPREGWNSNGFEEIFTATRRAFDGQGQGRVTRYAMVGKSLAPSWWALGTDRRWDFPTDDNPAFLDKGEYTLAPSTVATSLLFFRTMDRDYSELPDLPMRAAFSGLLSIWALVRSDGAAGMGYCPDSASRNFGMSYFTGDVGVGLSLYLRQVAAYCLPTRHAGGGVFGASFETEADGSILIRPWEGVGRRVVVRQFGLEVTVRNGRIQELRFDGTKRWVKVKIQNPADKEMRAQISIRGLWGRRVKIGPTSESNIGEAINGEVQLGCTLPASQSVMLEAEVVE